MLVTAVSDGSGTAVTASWSVLPMTWRVPSLSPTDPVVPMPSEPNRLVAEKSVYEPTSKPVTGVNVKSEKSRMPLPTCTLPEPTVTRSLAVPSRKARPPTPLAVETSSVPLPATASVPGVEPVISRLTSSCAMLRTPSPAVIPPVNELFPVRANVPEPNFVSWPAPEIVPE